MFDVGICSWRFGFLLIVTTILEFLSVSLHSFLSDLAELVNVDCGTHNKVGADRVGEWIGRRCATWGWEDERFPLTEQVDCWLARLPANRSGRILLMGHLDTV